MHYFFDQSFSEQNLEKTLKKIDLYKIPKKERENFKKELISNSIKSVNKTPILSDRPLESFTLQKKTVYKIRNHHDKLIERKLTKNLKNTFKIKPANRSGIVKCIKQLLEEGTPYRVYRLDIKSFFESFKKETIKEKILSERKLSQQSKSILERILKFHTEIEGNGTPRGLSISSIISEALMKDFDDYVKNHREVFYYSRYVDDIIIVTSKRECKEDFRKNLAKKLPNGLHLNKEKESILDSPNSKDTTDKITFDYLGYNFTVKSEGKIENKNNKPKKQNKESKNRFDETKNQKTIRKVQINISRKKIKRIKEKISRSLIDYRKKENFKLLLDRISFLTRNFSIENNNGVKRLSGIYYNYPMLSDDSNSLKELDSFVKRVLSKEERLSRNLCGSLSPRQKREIFSKTFKDGHSKKIFVHFSVRRISEIQRCWRK